MCTAINYLTKNHYFGRNLDVEHSYGEKIVITPRNYVFNFRNMPAVEHHPAIIGMAAVAENYPLYFEATNEYGLSMAGLNFPGNACYFPVKSGKDNIATFEFIPWILSQCKDVVQAKELLTKVNLTDISFNYQTPLSPLHWIVSDRNTSLTVESTDKGLNVYDNRLGILTNNPEFPMQMFNLNNYMQLSTDSPVNKLSDKLDLEVYSRGMGAMGLPGDLSSQSRFVRAAFTLLNSISGDSENESISQFFHILGAVAQQRGCVNVDGKYEITLYSSCCNTDKGIYYYTMYENNCITAIDMNKENLETAELIKYNLITTQNLFKQN